MATKPPQATADTESTDLAITTIPAAPLGKAVIPAAPPPDTNQPGSTVSTAADWQAKFAEELHQYVREYIRNADQKAAFFFAGATSLLAFLYSKGASGRWHTFDWKFLDTLAFLTMAFLVAGDFFLLWVVRPRLKGSKRGIFFYGAIAEFESARDFRDEVSSKTLGDTVQVKLSHSWELAKICDAKYWALTLGCWLTGIGAALGLVYLLASTPSVTSGQPATSTPAGVHQPSATNPAAAQPSSDATPRPTPP